MEKRILILTSIVTLTSGVSGIIALKDTYPSLVIISFAILFLSMLILVFYRFLFGQLILKNGFKRVSRKLNQLGFKPDIIVSFSRSGAISAGTMALNLNVQSCYVFSRVLKNSDSKKKEENRFEFEGIFKIDEGQFINKKVLVMSFSMFTCETVKAGLSHLEKMDVKTDDIKVASLCVNSSALRIFPDVVFGYVSNKPDRYLKMIPWILEDYPFI